MQRIAVCLVVLVGFATVSGCKDKDKGVEVGPTQSVSVDYQDPSPSYYAPDSSSRSADGYAYYDGSSAAPASSQGLTGGGSTHTVVKGDTLYSLARAYYGGDLSKWKVIYEANRGSISNPDVLKVGQSLIIP